MQPGAGPLPRRLVVDEHEGIERVTVRQPSSTSPSESIRSITMSPGSAALGCSAARIMSPACCPSPGRNERGLTSRGCSRRSQRDFPHTVLMNSGCVYKSASRTSHAPAAAARTLPPPSRAVRGAWISSAAQPSTTIRPESSSRTSPRARAGPTTPGRGRDDNHTNGRAAAFRRRCAPGRRHRRGRGRPWRPRVSRPGPRPAPSPYRAERRVPPLRATAPDGRPMRAPRAPVRGGCAKTPRFPRSPRTRRRRRR